MKKAFPILCWASLVVIGFAVLFAYANRPGPRTSSPHRWPQQSALPRNPSGYTLVFFAHPHCPCSRASMGEIERLMPHLVGKAQTHVLFFKPEQRPASWLQGPLWETAHAIPGVQTFVDEDGRQMRHFGVTTSGTTLLYDGEGRLVFRGGVTVARGHAGDSPGREAILAKVRSHSSSLKETPTFGCSLLAPEKAETRNL